MKVVVFFNFLLIFAEIHAPAKTRRKSEFRKSREKTLSRKTRILGAIGAATEVMSFIQVMIELVSVLNENSEPFDDCEDHSVKDELEIIKSTLRDYIRRIEAYKINRQEFHCDAFVTTVRKFKRMIERSNGLAHFCDFRWFVKKNGWFKDNTLEKMGAYADYVCERVASYGSCPSYASEYCEVRTPCMPNCDKCLPKLRSASRYVNYATGQLQTCQAQLQNVLQTQTVPTEVVRAESATRQSTRIDRTRTTLLKSDVFILVIPKYADKSNLQRGDGSSQISATINAPQNDYAEYAAFALVNGELHIFGGFSDSYKIARLDGCSLKELPARLNERRFYGHAAVSTENGRKALVCFGNFGDTRKSCEIFDGSSAVSTFAAEWTHSYGALGLYNDQPATVGCFAAPHQKAETLSATGWTALPDFSLKISSHSLVGLENGAMLLLGGWDYGTDNSQTGIWELKEEEWSRIGDLLKPATSGSAIYVSRSVYYFGVYNSAIHRVDLDENENLDAVEEIGRQPGKYYYPVLFQTDKDYCT